MHGMIYNLILRNTQPILVRRQLSHNLTVKIECQKIFFYFILLFFFLFLLPYSIFSFTLLFSKCYVFTCSIFKKTYYLLFYWLMKALNLLIQVPSILILIFRSIYVTEEEKWWWTLIGTSLNANFKL